MESSLYSLDIILGFKCYFYSKNFFLKKFFDIKKWLGYVFFGVNNFCLLYF